MFTIHRCVAQHVVGLTVNIPHLFLNGLKFIVAPTEEAVLRIRVSGISGLGSRRVTLLDGFCHGWWYAALALASPRSSGMCAHRKGGRPADTSAPQETRRSYASGRVGLSSNLGGALDAAGSQQQLQQQRCTRSAHPQDCVYVCRSNKPDGTVHAATTAVVVVHQGTQTAGPTAEADVGDEHTKAYN